ARFAAALLAPVFGPSSEPYFKHSGVLINAPDRRCRSPAGFRWIYLSYLRKKPWLSTSFMKLASIKSSAFLDDALPVCSRIYDSPSTVGYGGHGNCVLYSSYTSR